MNIDIYTAMELDLLLLELEESLEINREVENDSSAIQD